MPKRKATQSVDEWLSEGAAAIEERRTEALSSCNLEGTNELPTTYDLPVGTAINYGPKASNPVAPPDYVAPPESEVATEVDCPAAQGPISEAEAVEWFWDLLGKAGFERW